MSTEQSSYDPESFARIVLFQLASLRAEMIQTQRKVLEILEHQNNGTAAGYKKMVMDQESKKEIERDRIYQEMLKMAKIPAIPIPSGLDSLPQTDGGYSKN